MEALCAVHRPLLSGQDVALQESVLEILRALLDPSSMTVKVATDPAPQSLMCLHTERLSDGCCVQTHNIPCNMALCSTEVWADGKSSCAASNSHRAERLLGALL